MSEVEIHKKKVGAIPLCRADYGVPFHLFTNKEIKDIKDLSGLKFRSNANYVSFLKKLGIVP